MMDRFPRSFLFVPGDRPKLVDSAFQSAAEAIVFDLEDSVAAHQKARAREAVRAIVTGRRTVGPPLFVRVNGPETPEATTDLRALADTLVAGLVIPKVESITSVRRIVAETGSARLILLLETPRGILRALDLAEAAGRSLLALAFGAEDFRAAMRVDTVDADLLLGFAQSMVAVAAAAVDVPAIDAPEMDFADHDRLRAGAACARAAGFHAKFAIHPAQLAIIHESFTPTPAQRTWAERVTRAYEQGSSQGLGSVRVGDRVVDAATIKRARQILARSRA